MGRRVSDVLRGGGLGLFVGALPGLLAAGVYVTVRLQGDLRQVDLLTWPRLLLSGTGGEIVQGIRRAKTATKARARPESPSRTNVKRSSEPRRQRRSRSAWAYCAMSCRIFAPSWGSWTSSSKSAASALEMTMSLVRFAT